MLSKLAEKILMIPGWQGLQNTQLLAADLKKEGDDPVVLSYDAHNKRAYDIVDHTIIPALERNPGVPVFAHSTGALLLRLAAARNPDLFKGRKVTLAAPAVQGTPAANVGRVLGRIPFTPNLLDDKILTDLKWKSPTINASRPIWNADVTMVEATKSPKPHDLYGYLKKITLTPFGKNDGTLPLRTLERSVPEANRLYRMPYGHSQILTDPTARAELVGILTEARRSVKPRVSTSRVA